MKWLWYGAFSLGILLLIGYLNLPTWVALAYLVVAIGGAIMATQDARRSLTDGQGRETGTFAEVAAGSRRAHEAAEAEAWYPGAIEQLQARISDGRAKALQIGMGFGNANPYFLLPLTDLVAFGFATSDEVTEALRWARQPEPPLRWRNGFMLSEMADLGWPPDEALARAGILTWYRPSPMTGLRDDAISALGRDRGLVVDVPRPKVRPRASLADTDQLP